MEKWPVSEEFYVKVEIWLFSEFQLWKFLGEGCVVAMISISLAGGTRVVLNDKSPKKFKI